MLSSACLLFILSGNVMVEPAVILFIWFCTVLYLNSGDSIIVTTPGTTVWFSITALLYTAVTV